MRIVDVRDRLKPKEISTIKTPGFATSIEFLDGYVFLTDIQSGLYRIDVRNRHQPRTVAIQPTSGDAMGVSLFKSDVNETFGYIADGNPRSTSD